MKKVIIAGASGFIGRALTQKLLKEDVEIFAVVRSKGEIPEWKESTQLHIIEAELSEYSQLAEKYQFDDIDAFFHLAWEGTYGEYFKNYQMQMNNAVYSGDALNAAIQFKTKKFIMASTINVMEVIDYFGKSGIKPRYTCIYGASKLAAEMICKTLAYQKGIEMNIALIANSYGPGDRSKTIPNILISNLLKGKSPDLVEGDFLYDWVYIDDIVAGLCAIAEKGENQKSYYVGNQKLRTFKEIAGQVRDILAPSVELRFGVYPDAMALDYRKVDIGALYRDTGYAVVSDFEKNILETANWVKTLDIKI